MMTANAITSFPLGRISNDLGGIPVVYDLDRTFRSLVGISGDLGDGWTFTADYSHGTSITTNATTHDPILLNLYNAADVVTSSSGSPICRSTLTNPSNGCVPINLFGNGSPSQNAVNYVTGISQFRAFVQEDFAEANLRGNLFDDWAGTVSAAVGASYRSDSINQTSDAISQEYMNATGMGFNGFPVGYQGRLGGFDRSDFSRWPAHSMSRNSTVKPSCHCWAKPRYPGRLLQICQPVVPTIISIRVVRSAIKVDWCIRRQLMI